jgi:hypothetical protein
LNLTSIHSIIASERFALSLSFFSQKKSDRSDQAIAPFQPTNKPTKITMKLSVIVIAAVLALFAPSAVQARGFQVVTLAKDSEPDACASDEAALIESELVNTIKSVEGWKEQEGDLNGRNRHLQSLWCKKMCQYFYPGYCQHAFPFCWPLRRELRGSWEDSAEDSNADMADFFEPDNSVLCARSVVAMEAKYQSLADAMKTPSCKKFVAGEKEFQCYHMKE